MKSDNSKYISRNFSGAVVGSVGSVPFQIVPCSRLYLFSRSVGLLQCLVNVNYRVLIFSTCHFQSSSLFFILASSVCKSLQCLISTLKQGGEGGHLGSLVQLCCGEGGTPQTNITGMCGDWSQCMDHIGFSPAPGGVCFPSLHCSGSRVPCRGTVQSGDCISCNSQVSAAQVLGYSTKAQTRVAVHVVPFPGLSSAVSPLGSWSLAVMSTVQDPKKTSLLTGSLLTVWWRMLVSGAEIAAAPYFWLQLSHVCLSASGEWGVGWEVGACRQPASSPLVFSQSFVLWAGQAVH